MPAESRSPARAAARITVDARMIDRSGIGVYIRSVLPRVIAALPADRFLLIGGSALADRDRESERVAVRPSSAPIYSVREQLQLPLLTPGDTDLFWAPHYNVPLVLRSRTLVTVHDLAHLALPGLVRGRHRLAYARLMLRAAGGCSSTIFVSHFTADEFRRVFGRSPRRQVVIHQGVDSSWFEVTPDPVAPHPRPYLLFVGNVKPHKNLAGLLKAFRLLKDEIPHDLLIVGQRDGFIHGSPEVEREAAGMHGRVRFTGWVEDAEVRQLFAHASALVFPSLYEGFGLPPLEAMACGCPVVASRSGAIPEVCGDAVLYCEAERPESIAKQVRDLLADPILTNEMRSRGRERARGFSWDRCAAATGQVIERQLGR
jgi:glycosyltransferase involved in cell wall biosynthesis